MGASESDLGGPASAQNQLEESSLCCSSSCQKRDEAVFSRHDIIPAAYNIVEMAQPQSVAADVTVERPLLQLPEMVADEQAAASSPPLFRLPQEVAEEQVAASSPGSSITCSIHASSLTDIVTQPALPALTGPAEPSTAEAVKVSSQTAQGTASKADAAKKFFIRHVNPKFIYFDKPFLVASIVSFISAVIFASILWHLLVGCKTTEISKAGGKMSQIRFIAVARQSGAKICLHSSQVYNTFRSSFNGSDFEVLQESSCVVEEGIVSNKWERSKVEGFVAKKLLPFAEEGLEWCDSAPFRTKSECDKYSGTACPPCDPPPANHSNKLKSANAVFNLVYEETRCPTPSHMIGVALSFTSQCDVIVSLIVVFLLMGHGVLHQLDGKGGKEGLCAAAKAQLEADAESAAKTALNAV